MEALVGTVCAALTRADDGAEPALEAGKRRNVALGAPAFDGVVITPDRPLSFWRTLGPATERRGYTWGVELRGGCVVPAIAGGLCLLSNALFELAARAGWHVLERHGHSLEAIPLPPGALPLDATVAFPYIDLVVAPREGPVRLAVRVDADALVVEAFAARPPGERVELTAEEQIVTRGGDTLRRSRVVRRRLDAEGATLGVEEVARSERRILGPDERRRSCLTCGEHTCRDRPAEPTLVALRARR